METSINIDAQKMIVGTGIESAIGPNVVTIVEPFPTSWLQLESVVRFGEALGLSFDGRSFIKFNKQTRKKSYHSFMLIQSLHNMEEYNLSYRGYRMTYYGLLLALADEERLIYTAKQARLVNRSTLHYYKKKKSFIADQNWVKLC